ncbi:crotonase/enoyl-CoA hydratase family protein [Aliiglaciecola sp. CAU 1673]|uniref:crotonase/enoyl-CoA hydratase family protein n=1 Tax=Aliiglaciecola sp. CAU 1673 TaxID=3032595 RepID=UPI0023DC6FB4|nr:crotonase/enoyl-CoA hydratase family protein [Aliiglaciecola sp. CAU 1673]MDF2176887.1 crotonase/enoyl-CoA hydratase family protein [Aliiglaciecola sp. CAU 1673]
MTQRVLLEKRDAIAYVTLNRPDKHNGLDEAMFVELLDVAKRIKKDRSIRCVILQGAGPSFCAGLDFASVSKKPGMIVRFFLKLPWSKDNSFQRLAHCWRDLPMPVIAVVHGNCFGGGMQIALGCDYRIATPDAALSIMEAKWGIIPDMSATVTLSRLTRVDIAQELTMTGRIFSGEEGAQYGLISKTSEQPLAAAEELAKTLCQKSPDAVAAAKYLFKKTWKMDTRGALLWERLVQLRLLGRKNQRIAMQNGLSKGKDPKSFIDRTSF